MSFLPPDRAGRIQLLRKLVAGLCVFLILLVGAAQLLHTHTDHESINASCSLCAVAHVAPLPVPVLHRPMLQEVVQPIRAPDLVATSRKVYIFSLYTRPPPAVTFAF
jgi:hypothetical protein